MYNFFLLFALSFSVSAMNVRAIKVKGRVLDDFLAIKEGHIYRPGDVITAVDENSQVQLNFDDGSQFILKDGSIRLPERGADSYHLSLMRGILLLKKAPRKKLSVLNLRTKNGTVNVESEQLYINEKIEETYLVLGEGKAKIEINQNQYIQVLANEEVLWGKEKKIHKVKASLKSLKFLSQF
jgi:ferric-dicitrate binding protein FerR (iron transport regulator)